MRDKKKNGFNPKMGMGFAIGIGVGIAIGTALENIAVGIAVGVGVGVVFVLGVFSEKSGKQKGAKVAGGDATR